MINKVILIGNLGRAPEDQPDAGAPSPDPWLASYEAAQQQTP